MDSIWELIRAISTLFIAKNPSIILCKRTKLEISIMKLQIAQPNLEN